VGDTPMVPENARHFCAFTKTEIVGSWANECPNKCMEIVLSREEWRNWTARMAELQAGGLKSPSFDEVFMRIISLDDQFIENWRALPLIYWTNAMAGEVGELCNQAKKLAGGGTKGDGSSVAKIKEEIADTFTYIVLIWAGLGGTPQELIQEVLAKNEVNRQRLIARGIIRINI